MKIFFRLLLAHLLTDFTLQTNFIAKWKKKSFLGVVVHSLSFFIFGLILTWEDLNKIWFNYPVKLSGIWCLIILFVLHVIEDEYRSYNVRHYHIQDTILFFLWDQVIHIVLIFIFSPFNELETEPWVIIMCILIVGTHVLSVLLLYIDMFFYSKDIAYSFFNKKYYSILINLAVMLCFLLPYKLYFISLLIAPISWILNRKFKFLSSLNWWINTAVSYGFGILILYTLGEL